MENEKEKYQKMVVDELDYIQSIIQQLPDKVPDLGKSDCPRCVCSYISERISERKESVLAFFEKINSSNDNEKH